MGRLGLPSSSGTGGYCVVLGEEQLSHGCSHFAHGQDTDDRLSRGRRGRHEELVKFVAIGLRVDAC